MPRQDNYNPEDAERRLERYKTTSRDRGVDDPSAGRYKNQENSDRYTARKRYPTDAQESQGRGKNSSKYTGSSYGKKPFPRSSSPRTSSGASVTWDQKKSFHPRQSGVGKNSGFRDRSDSQAFGADKSFEGTGFAGRRPSTNYRERSSFSNDPSRSYTGGGRNTRSEKSFHPRQSGVGRNSGFRDRSDSQAFGTDKSFDGTGFAGRRPSTNYRERSSFSNDPSRSYTGGGRNTRSEKSFSSDKTSRDKFRTQRTPYKGQGRAEDRESFLNRPSWGSVARNGAKQFRSSAARTPYDKASNEVSDSRTLPSDSSSFDAKGAFANQVHYKLVASGAKKSNSIRDKKEVKKPTKTPYQDKANSQFEQSRFTKKTTENPPHELKSSFGEVADLSLKDVIVPRRLARAESVLEYATKAYAQDRFGEVITMLNSLGKEALMVGEVAELLGLALYRQGKWSLALKVLAGFTQASGSFDQYPVLMDLNRALGRHKQVEVLYEELRQSGVSSDLIAEARIVMAGDLADRGQLQEAIKTIAPSASRQVSRPQARHIRQWFALADLYERVGEIALARSFYTKVLNADPTMADVAERLAALS